MAAHAPGDGATGCSTSSHVESRVVEKAGEACSSAKAPFASSRSRMAGPTAARIAARRARSLAWSRPTLSLSVPKPSAASRAASDAAFSRLAIADQAVHRAGAASHSRQPRSAEKAPRRRQHPGPGPRHRQRHTAVQPAQASVIPAPDRHRTRWVRFEFPGSLEGFAGPVTARERTQQVTAFNDGTAGILGERGSFTETDECLRPLRTSTANPSRSASVPYEARNSAVNGTRNGRQRTRSTSGTH